MDTFKNIGIQFTLALCAAFSNVAATAADVVPATRLEQVKTGSPAAKIARDLYEKPTNDLTLNAAKGELMKLPAGQISEARSVYHTMANDERALAKQVGQSLAWADGRHAIDEIKSPEIKAALTGLQQQIASDKQKGDKTTPYERMSQVIQKVDSDSHTREDAFKTVVQEAITEKRAMDRETLKKQGAILGS